MAMAAFSTSSALHAARLSLPPPLPPHFRSWRSPSVPCSASGGGETLAARPLAIRLHRLFVAQRTVRAEAQEEEGEDEERGTAEERETEVTQEPVVVEPTPAAVQVLIDCYKEAFSSNDASKMLDIESKLLALQGHRDELQQQVAVLTEEASSGKERFLRLSADFDNFRKRSERDRLGMSRTVKGDAIQSFLPVVDNFERAKDLTRAETEGEITIDNSYQGIYKQLVEIMRGLGVSVVETVGKEFNPNLHEAIMQEESADYEESTIIQELRRGFMLGDKLLRPAMVKVSAGPGPMPSVHAIEASPGEVSEEVVEEVKVETEQMP